jgi:lysophosphatidylcholine acyltransferase/lyso-PAF acetyltransferase
MSKYACTFAAKQSVERTPFYGLMSQAY